MSDRDERIVVVGAGECGARAALTLRSEGWLGHISLIGDEGFYPYERPPLSKAAWSDLSGDGPPPAVDAETFEASGIDFLADSAATTVHLDARIVEVASGISLGYDRLILATGARARLLDVPGGSHACVLRTWNDLLRLRPLLVANQRVGVIGAGFIGMELASVAAELGCHVTIIEVAPRVLARAVPAAIAAKVADRHLTAGVDLRLERAVVRIDSLALGLSIALDDGSSVACDVVVAGIGSIPNVELAQRAGLQVDNGIKVDAHLRTSNEFVLAAGDCCSFLHPLFGGRRLRLESWRSALEQGGLAARNALGANEALSAVPWFWSDQFDLGLQIAGLPDEAVSNVNRNRPDGGLVEFGLDVEGRLVSASSIGSGTQTAKDVRIAEMLIARRAHPDPTHLGDPNANLKPLLISKEPQH